MFKQESPVTLPTFLDLLEEGERAKWKQGSHLRGVVEVQARSDIAAPVGMKRSGQVWRCGVTSGLDADVHRREPGMAPSFLVVGGWLRLGTSAEKQVSKMGREGNQEIYFHLFLEEESISPNTQLSGGKEQILFTCSWALNKCFQ